MYRGSTAVVLYIDDAHSINVQLPKARAHHKVATRVLLTCTRTRKRRHYNTMATGGAPFDVLSSLDPETFAGESRAVINFLADYYRAVDTYPVQPQDLPGCLRALLPDAPPENGEPIDVILEEVRTHIVPALTHWQSPKFFGYFPMNASTAGFAGEMLSTGLNIVPFMRVASPAATELESAVVDWMGKLVGLPDRFLFSGGGGGVLHGSTCEAVVCTLAAARDRALSNLGHEAILRLVVYASDQSHYTFQKGERMNRSMTMRGRSDWHNWRNIIFVTPLQRTGSFASDL